MKNMKMIFFSLYSYISNIGWKLLDLSPPFLRSIVFKLCLKNMGRGSWIDYGCHLRYMKQIRIGSGVSINRGSKFFASHSYKDVFITIGDNTAIGPGTVFFAAGHDYSDMGLPDTAGNITVCDNVWIGGNTTIVCGGGGYLLGKAR